MPKENLLHPGFYEIPDYPNYLISEDGKVFNIVSNEFLQGSTNPAGYVNFRITNANGTLTWGRHRLLMYAFKPVENYKELDVNHKNAIKGDDRLDNLEWVTELQNLEHAALLGISPKFLPMSTRCVKTGVVTKFMSCTACAKELGMTKDAVLWRIKKGEAWVFPELRQYRLGHSDANWKVPEDIEAALRLNGSARGVVVKDLIEKTETVFEEAAIAAKHLSFSPAGLFRWLSAEGQPVFRERFQIKYIDDKTPWREVDNILEDLLSAGRRNPVLLINEKTGCKTVFVRPKDCSVKMGVKPTTLNERLKSNFTKVYADGHRYGYYEVFKLSAASETV